LEVEIGAERVIKTHGVVIDYVLLGCNLDTLPGSGCRGFPAHDVDELTPGKCEAGVGSVLPVLVFTFPEAVTAVIHLGHADTTTTG
jgi:hypothetical protein